MSEKLEQVDELDRRVVGLMNDYAIPFLRVSLGITYIWFGALKVVGASPVADLVAKTAFFLPRRVVVPFIGLWEIAVGVGLLLRFPLRLTLIAYFMQLAGTFMTFLVRPEETFQKRKPFLLTERGEFVVKNLVLASAGLVVGSTMRRRSERVQDARVR